MTTPEGSQPSGTEATLQQKFFRYFQHEVTALQEQMDRLADRPAIAGERADAADHCLAGIGRLSCEVKDASTYLPAYDQRTYSEAIKALQDRLQETRATFAPKQKFSFKSARKSPSAVSLSDAAELAAQKRRGIPGYLSPNGNTPDSSLSATPGYLQTPPNERSTTNRPVPDSAPPPSSLQQATSAPHTPEEPPTSSSATTDATSSTSLSITSQTHAHIILPTTSTRPNTPCTISNLTSCVLDLSTPPLSHTSTSTTPSSNTSTSNAFASLTLTNISTSLLLLGTASGPAHITNLRNSVLVITCRQLRMHDCEDVDVYLHCTSRPIIEACRGVRFTTLPASHLPPRAAAAAAASATETEQSTTSKEEVSASQALHNSPNLYDQVDDFKWLKSEPSPNWSVMKDSERVAEEVWREVVPGGMGRSVGDILKAVGISGAGGGAVAAASEEKS